MTDQHEFHIYECSDTHAQARTLCVIRETSLYITVNEQSLVRLACTGKAPAYLAAGFLFSCGVINKAEDITSLDIHEEGTTLEARVRVRHPFTLPTKTVTSGLGWNFHMPSRTLAPLPRPAAPLWRPSTIIRLAAELDARCELYRLTRGCHSSSLCNEEGIVLFREDIGRHNAIETIIGQCLLEHIDTTHMMILSTGRIASEIVQKTIRAGITLMASTAVATSLAVEMARELGLGLVGNIQKDTLWVYNDNGQLILPQP